MAGELENITAELGSQSQEIISQVIDNLLQTFMPIIKIGGVILSLYVIYLIIKFIGNIKQRNRIKRIEKNTEEILSILKKEKAPKEEKEISKPEEKKKAKNKK